MLVKGAGGMANRMQGAIAGILLARLTRRTLLVDWSDHYYATDGSNVFHQFFRCPAASRSDRAPSTDSVLPAIWRGHLRESVYEMRRRYGDRPALWRWPTFSFDLTTADAQEDVLVLWSYSHHIERLRETFQDAFERLAQGDANQILRRLLHNDLVLCPSIRDRVDDFREKHFRGRTVGVHVRFTDQRSRLWTILRKLNALVHREPGLRIFLATDNRQILRLFEESYGGTVVATPHWYSPVPGLALHNHPGRAAPMQGGIEALVDLYLLAETDYLIVDSSSSFSYLATLLTNAPDAHVLDVGNRVKPSPARRRLVARLMLMLGLHSWGLTVLSKAARMERRFTR